MSTIHCEDCGKPRTKVPSNTKRCRRCALARFLAWNDGRHHTCEVCEQRFAPLKQTERRCGTCLPTDTGKQNAENVEDFCKECGRKAWLFSTEIRWCYGCLRAPEHRSRLRVALLRQWRTATQEHTDAG